MLDAQSSTRHETDSQARSVFGRACVPWSADDIAKLRQIAPRPSKKAQLLNMFPERNLPAIKTKLAEVRASMGLTRENDRSTGNAGMMLDPDEQGIFDTDHLAWKRSCVRQNAAFLAALQRAGSQQV